jgi:hypothetical protein
MELSIWRPFQLMPFVERNYLPGTGGSYPCRSPAGEIMIGGTSPMLTDRHPELLGLEGFINHAEEQNEDLKLCLLSIEKLFRRRELLYLWMLAGKSQNSRMWKTGIRSSAKVFPRHMRDVVLMNSCGNCKVYSAFTQIITIIAKPLDEGQFSQQLWW